MGGGIRPPLDVVLSWHPNYVDPPRRGPSVVVMSGVLLGLVYIVVGLRVYARTVQARTFGLDDALIVFNLIPLTGFNVCIWLAYLKYGLDKHVWDVPLNLLIQDRKVVFANILLYTFANTITKISILLFYRRLTAGTLSRSYRITLYATISSVLVYFLTFTIITFVGCRPMNAFWDQLNPFWDPANDYFCVNEAAVIISAAVINILQDFMVCFLPTVLFWKLRTSRTKKSALMAIFGIGFCVCVCSILRATYVKRLYFDTYDETWDSWNIWVVTTAELNVAVICASAPALNHFFRHISDGGSVSSHIKSRMGGHSTQWASTPSLSHKESESHLISDGEGIRLDRQDKIRVVSDIMVSSSRWKL